MHNSDSDIFHCDHTTATPRLLGFRSTSTADYSQCWTLLPDSSTGKVGANTSPLFCESSIGYGPKSVSTSNSPFSFSGVFTVWRHAIYLTTYVALPTPIAGSCVQHRPVHCQANAACHHGWPSLSSYRLSTLEQSAVRGHLCSHAACFLQPSKDVPVSTFLPSRLDTFYPRPPVV